VIAFEKQPVLLGVRRQTRQRRNRHGFCISATVGPTATLRLRKNRAGSGMPINVRAAAAEGCFSKAGRFDGEGLVGGCLLDGKLQFAKEDHATAIGIVLRAAAVRRDVG